MKDGSDDRTMLSDSEAQPTHVDGDESYCAACGGSFPFDVDVCPKDGARLAKLKAQPDALLGRVFDGRFEVRTALGQGGMGTVYRGWQLTVDREIAIKVIHPKLASDRIAVKRFLREARLSSRLNQPNIVNVYDFGQTEDGVLYIAMELLRGHTLGRELESMRPMALRRVLTIGQQLCDALDSAHGQGIVHRDLKPNNIVILDDPPGRDLIKVLDFGLAKSLITDTSSLVTNTNAILGTPLYMPPEQIEGKPSDQRADLYSLGCILYQMMTGRPPFTGESVNVVLAAHISDLPAALPVSVPPVFARTIERLMEKDPTKRMQSAREAREAMQAILEGGPGVFDEVYDTTPDIRPSLLETGPIALAVTDPAHAMATPVPRRPSTSPSSPSSSSTSSRDASSSPGTAAVATSASTVTTSRMKWLLPLVLLGAVGSGGLAMFIVMSDDEYGPQPAVKPPPTPDPMLVIEPAADAAAVELPVATLIDAGTSIPPDAASAPATGSAGKPPKPRPKPPKPPLPDPKPPEPKPPATGSGSSEPSLPFLKSRGSGSGG